MTSRRLFLVVPVVLALGLGTTGAAAQQPSGDSLLGTARSTPGPQNPLDLPGGSVLADGPIYDLLGAGDRLYAVGGFRTIGRYAGPGDLLDAATGETTTSPGIADGQISVVVSDGTGGWYLGGDFSRIGGHPSGGLAHVLDDGTLDPAFLPVTDGLVSAMSLDGDTLYVGGDFSTVDGITRTHLAALSTVDGSVLPLSAPQSARVTELVATPGVLYVGSDHLTALDPATGDHLSAFVPPVIGDVHALALGGGRLYVGGHDLMALDPATGARDPAFDPGRPRAHRSYHSLVWTEGVLYVGSDRNRRLAALDPATGHTVQGFAPELAGENGTSGGPGGVYDLALDGDRLWVAGSFTSAGGTTAHGLAVLDATTGARTDTGLPAYNRQVNAVELAGGHAFVGGTFFMSHWRRSRGIAALDATTLEPLPGFRVPHHAYGEPMLTDAALYLAPNHFEGYETWAGSDYYYSYTSRISAFDPDTGAALEGLTRKVRNLTGVTTIGNRLYVARRLENDVKFPHNRIVVYGPNGHRQRSFDVPLRGYITTLSSVGGDLVVAGSFKRRTSTGAPANTAMLRLDPLTGARRTWFDPKINGPVYEVARQGSDLYAAGVFKQVYQGIGFDRPGLVKLTSGSHKVDAFAPSGFPGRRFQLTLHPLGDLLFVNGWPQLFLDATTGERAASPAGGGTVVSMATTPGGYAYAGNLYPNLGGRTGLRLGFIAPAP